MISFDHEATFTYPVTASTNGQKYFTESVVF